jgi:hypothetical protein
MCAADCCGARVPDDPIVVTIPAAVRGRDGFRGGTAVPAVALVVINPWRRRQAVLALRKGIPTRRTPRGRARKSLVTLDGETGELRERAGSPARSRAVGRRAFRTEDSKILKLRGRAIRSLADQRVFGRWFQTRYHNIDLRNGVRARRDRRNGHVIGPKSGGRTFSS